MVAKIVYNVIVSGPGHAIEKQIIFIDAKFVFGTILHGPGHLRYFSINIVQHEDFSIEVNDDDKLTALEFISAESDTNQSINPSI